MNLTVNGQSQVPPGFRFHPTEEELLQYYLKKKVANQKIDLDVIQEVDLNKLEPWDIQEKCRIGSSAQNDWYLFSHKDKKYPTGTRTNRATTAGFWKATGRDKLIFSSSRRIGMRKTLVFYKGRAPHGEKSDWIMHEYRLDDNNNNASSSSGDQISTTEDGWVICRVFKKKNYVKAFDSPKDRISPRSTTHNIDQTLSYLGKSSTHMDQERFLHLPQLQSPTNHHHHHITTDPLPFDHKNEDQDSRLNWVELDQLVAYQLNGESSREASQSSANQFCTMMPFQQLLGSQFVDDQLYWSFNIPSSTSALLDSDYNS